MYNVKDMERKEDKQTTHNGSTEQAVEPISVEPGRQPRYGAGQTPEEVYWPLSEHLQNPHGNVVCSRRPGQMIFLGENGIFSIRITVLEVDGMQVRLGIKAEPMVKIIRRELLRKKPTDNSSATEQIILPQSS